MNINWNNHSQVQRLLEDFSLRLLKISSITSDSIGIKKAFCELEKICEELDFYCDYQANGMIMRITNNPINFDINCMLALICHIDTVEFDTSKWSHNPLGEIKDGRIFGRGIIDDKGAIVLSLLAAKACENHIHKPWIIIVGSSEEGIWQDMENYHSENHPIPDYATTIDGDGVQAGCRGTANVSFSFKRQCSNGNLLEKICIPGQANNIIPGNANAVFSNGLQILSTGKACHSSIPQNGDNALISLSKKIESDCYDQFPGFFNLMKNFENCTINNFEGSVSPTTCQIQDNLLTVNLNFRLPIGTHKKEFLDFLSEMMSSYSAKFEISNLIMPGFMDINSPMIKSQLKAYKQILGLKTTATIAPGTGYNSAFRAKYGCNIFGPRFALNDDEEDLCHCDDESRLISDLMKFYKMLCMFMKDFLS